MAFNVASQQAAKKREQSQTIWKLHLKTEIAVPNLSI